MKLIRDNYDKLIEEDRLYIETDKDKQLKLLSNKIIEEIKELQETNFEDINEWGDVFQVLFDILEHKNIDIKDVRKARKAKLNKLGGFTKFLVLK